MYWIRMIVPALSGAITGGWLHSRYGDSLYSAWSVLIGADTDKSLPSIWQQLLANAIVGCLRLPPKRDCHGSRVWNNRASVSIALPN
jgi:hypothetical protein